MGRRRLIAALAISSLAVAATAAAVVVATTHPAVAATRAARTHAAPAAARTKSLAGKVILIDPGHNVNNWRHPAQINRPVFYGIPGQTKPCDTTGTSTDSGYPEARYTLAVGLHAVKILRDMGATVVMTPVNTRPWGPCITGRAALGNSIHADAAVSIHADGAPSWVHGFYVIAPSTPLPGVGLGPKRIARDVKLGAAMLKAYHVTTGMKISNLYTSGYLRSDGYGGTNLSHVPKIFIETGNMRSPGNARKLESPAFRHLAAWGIAYGIRLYLTGHM
ncbi:MAG TPA: N-acetylmuramoyl-L-alanine amidase [Gaiellales bacterium]